MDRLLKNELRGSKGDLKRPCDRAWKDYQDKFSLLEKEIEMIKLALKRSNGKRKVAAEELGISERTLYRKIKQFDLNDIIQSI